MKYNWLEVWKMAWGIWKIFTRALESLKIGLWSNPFIQSIKCMRLKFTEELCVMTIKNDAKFEEELTCQFKMDMRNWLNFNPSTQKISKIYTLMGCFWPKYVMFGLKMYWRVLKTGLCFQKWHEIGSKIAISL